MVTKLELEELQKKRQFDDEIVKVMVARYLDTLCDRLDGYYDPYNEYEYDMPFEKIFYEDLILTHSSQDLHFWRCDEFPDDDSEEAMIVFEPLNIMLHESPKEADTVSLEIVTSVPMDCQFVKYLDYKVGQDLAENPCEEGYFRFELGLLVSEDKGELLGRRVFRDVYITYKQSDENDSDDVVVSFIMPNIPRKWISCEFLKILLDERKKKDEERG